MPKGFVVTSAIVCDDIRVENNQKLLVIGVYTGKILVSQMPAQLRLCVLTILENVPAGDVPFHLEMSGPDFHINGEGSIHVVPKEPVTIFTPQLQFEVARPGELVVELALGDSKPRNLLRKEIGIMDPPEGS